MQFYITSYLLKYTVISQQYQTHKDDKQLTSITKKVPMVQKHLGTVAVQVFFFFSRGSTAKSSQIYL